MKHTTTRPLGVALLAALLCTATLVSFTATSFAQSLPTKPVLTLEAAKQAADACEAMANAKGWRINLAIVDDGAHLVLFRHMGGSPLISRDIAIRKAETAVRIPRPTRALAERAYGTADKPAAAPGIAAIGGLTLFAGGLPIKHGDTAIGGIGVSGVTADQDEECAQAGIDAIAGLLGAAPGN